MCGIVGYIGTKEALPILVKGLQRLEYRGYDSSGVAVIENGIRIKETSLPAGRQGTSDATVRTVKAVGKIENLVQKLAAEKVTGTMGIAHTRWATHGGVTEPNAHPHTDCSGTVAVVHNGIIENYRELKEEFLSNHSLVSETDTEIIAHLIEIFYHGDLRRAVEEALSHVQGTYGLVVMHTDSPRELVAARMGSPLAIGMGEHEYFIASDTSPMLAYTQQVIFLDDGEIVRITDAGIETFNVERESVVKTPRTIEWNEAEAERGGYPHFMLKEIFDQPTVVMDAMRGRLVEKDGSARLGGLNMTEKEIQQIERIILIACGTAAHAALIGKYAIERLAGIPTSIEIASEFRYSDPIINNKTLVFGISQSGETADTLAALREAKRKGAYVRGIVNVIGSTIARETDGGTYMHAGPELAVASTKAYTNMVAVLLMYALQFGRSRRLSLATGERVVRALLEVPEKMKQVFEHSDKIQALAKKYSVYKNFFFIGRGVQYPVALEGSLKLKEITYIHSEAYPAGEMKHGPIALLSPEFPVIGIMTKNQLYDKMRNNIEEARARHAPLLLIATEGDTLAQELSTDVLYVPDSMELVQPLISTIPLQLFAYHMAVILGKDVDRPRNLAKSVTVE